MDPKKEGDAGGGGLHFEELFSGDETPPSDDPGPTPPAAADVPQAPVTLLEALAAIHAIHQHGTEVEDPYVAALVRELLFPDAVAAAMKALTPESLTALIREPDGADQATFRALVALLELKTHIELAYWSPLVDAGRRGDFTAHRSPMLAIVQLCKELSTACAAGVEQQRWTEEDASSIARRLTALVNRVLAVMPEARREQAPAATTYDAGATRKSVASEPVGTQTVREATMEQLAPIRRFWTPLRAGIVLGVAVITGVLALAIGSRGPSDVAGDYTGTVPIEQMFRSEQAVQVIVSSDMLTMDEPALLTALNSIDTEIDGSRRLMVTFFTKGGMPLAERQPGGEVVLLALANPAGQ